MSTNRIRIMNIQAIKCSLSEELVLEQQTEKEQREYSWVDDAEGLSWESFSRTFPKHKHWFFTLLDVSVSEGWQQLASGLGLNIDEIKWCERYCGPQGPSAASFSKLLQRQDQPPLSLHHVLYHLINLGRHDLLRRIPWVSCIADLHQNVIKQDQQGRDTQQHEQHQLNALRHITPSLPASVRVTADVKKRPYACSVLMVFAEDAREFALQACSQLRSSVPSSRGRIGVLLLEEQRHLLQHDPHTLLHKWFMQVDYIVPVLSPDLLQHFSCWSIGVAPPPSLTPSSGAVDPMRPLHHRYLYRLTLDQYVAQASLNTRCRPLCAAAHSKKVCSSELVRTQGILQVVTVCQNHSTNNNTTNTPSSPTNTSGSSAPLNQSLETFALLLLKSAARPLQ